LKSKTKRFRFHSVSDQNNTFLMANVKFSFRGNLLNKSLRFYVILIVRSQTDRHTVNIKFRYFQIRLDH